MCSIHKEVLCIYSMFTAKTSNEKDPIALLVASLKTAAPLLVSLCSQLFQRLRELWGSFNGKWFPSGIFSI